MGSLQKLRPHGWFHGLPFSGLSKKRSRWLVFDNLKGDKKEKQLAVQGPLEQVSPGQRAAPRSSSTNHFEGAEACLIQHDPPKWVHTTVRCISDVQRVPK